MEQLDGLETSGPILKRLDRFWIDFMGFETIGPVLIWLDQFETSGPVLKRMDLFWNDWTGFETTARVLKPLDLFWNYWTGFETIGSALKRLGLILKWLDRFEMQLDYVHEFLYRFELVYFWFDTCFSIYYYHRPCATAVLNESEATDGSINSTSDLQMGLLTPPPTWRKT